MRDIESMCEQAGLGKLSKTTASRICEQLRERIEQFKRRDLYEVQLAALFRDGKARAGASLDPTVVGRPQQARAGGPWRHPLYQGSSGGSARAAFRPPLRFVRCTARTGVARRCRASLDAIRG
jgi:hypothetical protein